MLSVAESRISRADRRARTICERLGIELRQARLIDGLTLTQVSDAVRLSASEVSRIERGRAPWVDVPTLARLAAVVGLDVWVRLYPGGEPLRDLAHLALTDAFRAMLGPGLMVRAEVPIGDPRDLRAWDLTLEDRRSEHCGVELETRLVDAQDQLRRVSRKAADSGLERVVLVVADTRANRAAIDAAASMLSATFVIDDPAAYEALARDEVPPRSALVLVKMARPRRQRCPLPRSPRSVCAAPRQRGGPANAGRRQRGGPANAGRRQRGGRQREAGTATQGAATRAPATRRPGNAGRNSNERAGDPARSFRGTGLGLPEVRPVAGWVRGSAGPGR